MNRYGMQFVPFVGVNNHCKTIVFASAIVLDETEDTYVWLLESFMKAMCQEKPRGIITDGDASMIKAIAKVFPGIWHHVCAWHLDKNMKKNLYHKSLNEFRTLLYYTMSKTIFEERWSDFVRNWQTDQTKQWPKRMYKRKKLWAGAFLADGYFLGMKSNQRSESMNSCLHIHLDSGMTLVDLIMHYEIAIVRVREDEARLDKEDSPTLPMPITKYRELEVSASHMFSAANFYILQEELKK